MSLDVYIAKKYDLSLGDTTFISDSIPGYVAYTVDLIWANVTGTLDASLLIRQTDDEKVFESLKTEILDSEKETRVAFNVSLTKDKLSIKLSVNGVTGGNLSIRIRAVENVSLIDRIFRAGTDALVSLGSVTRKFKDAFLSRELRVGTGVAIVQILNGNITMPKESGQGIKIDPASSDFGFRDILGDVFARNTGASKPSFTTYRDTLLDFQFAANDEEYFKFHIPHDYVLGTDVFLHIHWSHTGALVTGGTITFEYEISYAKGHNQGAFGASVDTTFNGSASTTQYQHIITEVQVSAASPDGNQIDSDDLEPDGVIIARLKVTSNDITVSGGGVPDPFIHYADIHYQSTNIGTKDKIPDFYT